MANIGEWQFSSTTTEPPVNGQLRLNNSGQTIATAMWVHKNGATGIDASGVLPGFNAGHLLRVQDKSDSSKWQRYLVTGTPVAKTDYWEYPVVWQAGGTVVGNGVRVLFDNVGIRVPAIGKAATVSVGTASVFLSGNVSVAVEMPPLHAHSGPVEITGQLIIFDYAYPFEGKNYTSPGMTLRQYYAAQAMLGFIAGSNVPASNLVGKVAAFAFTAADSMIAFEAKERAGYLMPVAGSDRNAPATSVVVPPVDDGASLKPAPASPTLKAVWPRKIIS